MSTNFCVESILQSINSNSSEEDSNKNSPQLPISNKSPSSSSSNFESSQKAFSPKKPDSPVQKTTTKRKADKENKKPAKRTRTCFERAQLIYLEKIFAETPYPDKLLKDEIAEKHSLAPQRIHVSIL